MRWITVPLAVLLIAVISGCVSNHMKQYVGYDIREVMVDSGRPVNVFDMGDGRRAFQFYWGGGSYVVPQTTTGTVTATGNTAQWTSTTVGGVVVSGEGCLITYFAEHDETRDAWIVADYSYPKQLVC